MIYDGFDGVWESMILQHSFEQKMEVFEHWDELHMGMEGISLMTWIIILIIVMINMMSNETITSARSCTDTCYYKPTSVHFLNESIIISSPGAWLQGGWEESLATADLCSTPYKMTMTMTRVDILGSHRVCPDLSWTPCVLCSLWISLRCKCEAEPAVR